MILDLLQRESYAEMVTDRQVSLRALREGYLHHPYPYNQSTDISLHSNEREALVPRGAFLNAYGYETLTAETTLAAYEQAIQLAPREAVLYYHKARALEELGRATEAQQSYQEAQRLGYTL